MRSRTYLGLVSGLALLAAIATALPVRAEDAPAGPVGCDVPSSLLETDSRLPKVTEAVKAGHPLDILVVGSRSSTIGSDATNSILNPGGSLNVFCSCSGVSQTRRSV